MKRTILGITRPSSRETQSPLRAHIEELEALGFDVKFYEAEPSVSWPYTAGSATDRATSLAALLLDPEVDCVMAARGGYGASDLLPLLPWDQLEKAQPKMLVGFSDTTALQTALWSKLRWPSIHGPMLGSNLWSSTSPSTEALLQIISTHRARAGSLDIIDSWSATADSISGRVLGGCMSVVTNLIGTPYFLASKEPFILFLEDIDESPAKLTRYLNQWIQSGHLRNCQAIVLGKFQKISGTGSKPATEELGFQFSMRTGLPVYHSASFGHIEDNWPIGIGAQGIVSKQIFSWELDHGGSGASHQA